MNTSLHPAEYLPILIYLIVLFYLGLRRRTTGTEEDFVLAGRSLTLPAFVATLVTTWYGGILGVGEFTYLYGLSNWLVFGFPYYVFALAFAIFLAPRIRQTSMLSIPDQFYAHYSPKAGFLGAIYTFFMTLPAPYILMVGILLQWITGWPLAICIVLGAIFSMGYVWLGGFRSVIRTDKLQFVLMFGGFFVLFVYLYHQYGGFTFLKTHLPAEHLTLTGGHSGSYLLVWFFIASWTFIDPGFHQRCYAARDPATARKGILISVLFWFVFDFLTTSTGLYARALMEIPTPTLVYPALSHQLLPPFVSGLFLTGLLATIMSTIDSLSLLAAITLGHDVWERLSPRTSPNRITPIKVGLLIATLASILLAIFFPSVIQLWYIIGTLFIPPMLLPLLAVYFPSIRPRPRWILANLILAFTTSFIFLLLSLLQSPSIYQIQYFGNIQPMYPGLLVSLLIFVTGNVIRKHRESSSTSNLTRNEQPPDSAS
ncbi:MAG: sodium:solute symporter family protein [Calditrichaeota bacterium]|nr:sodium:solute symporter family protein [Calditrichota bacterium]